MKVSILAHTPNIENVIASSGRLCYSKVGVNELLQKHSKEDNERFIKMLADMGHHSPLEHVSFTFAVEGVSRALTHQLVRHRIASYSQQSQRYVNLDKTFDYIMPPSIEKNEVTTTVFENAMKDIKRYYNYLVDSLEESYISNGMNKREANKKAIEDARYV